MSVVSELLFLVKVAALVCVYSDYITRTQIHTRHISAIDFSWIFIFQKINDACCLFLVYSNISHLIFFSCMYSYSLLYSTHLQPAIVKPFLSLYVYTWCTIKLLKVYLEMKIRRNAILKDCFITNIYQAHENKKTCVYLTH